MRACSAVVGCFLLVAGQVWAAPDPAPEAPIPAPLPEMGNPVPTGTPIRVLEVGDVAPAFSFPGADGRWRSFARLTEKGPVLLVFGARDGDVEGLARWRRGFDELGLTTAIAVESGARAMRQDVARLGMTAVVIDDPGCAIACLFNTLDPLTLQHAASFFVVGSDHQVRALRHGPLPPPLQMLGASARGLGMPVPESAVSLLGWVAP
jgi:hypothetical protein